MILTAAQIIGGRGEMATPQLREHRPLQRKTVVRIAVEASRRRRGAGEIEIRRAVARSTASGRQQ